LQHKMHIYLPLIAYQPFYQLYYTRWGYPCLAWVCQPAPPPCSHVSQPAFKFKRFSISLIKSFCCSFFFLLRIFSSRTKSFIDIDFKKVLLAFKKKTLMGTNMPAGIKFGSTGLPYHIVNYPYIS
jgi:hypothetical protein